MMSFIINILEQGSLYSILTLGVMISYQILGISDLSVDGTYPLGAVISAVLIKNGFSPWISLLFAFIGGGLAGSVTGILNTKLKISNLLSGILVMTALYSINLVIAGGRSNLPLLQEKTLFDNFIFDKIGTTPYQKVIVLFLIIFGLKLVIDWLFSTRLGYLFKLVGDNENLISELGHNPETIKIIGLAVSNSLVALSGGVAVSLSRYYDISIGTGMIILGLSSGILGVTLLKKSKFKLTSMVIVGAIIYRFIVALAIRYGLQPQYLRLVTVIIFIATLLLNQTTKLNSKRKVEENVGI